MPREVNIYPLVWKEHEQECNSDLDISFDVVLQMVARYVKLNIRMQVRV